MDIITTMSGDLSILQSLTIAFLVVTLVTFSLRVYVRAGLLRSFGWDDWTMLLAMIFFTLCATFSFLLVKDIRNLLSGRGSDQDRIILSAKLGVSFYAFSMITLKISLGIFFLKIFVASRWQRVVVYITMAISTAYGIVYIGLSIGSCGLTFAFFPGSETCNSRDAFRNVNYSWSILNAITDVIFAVLSVVALWPAHLPLVTKLIAAGLLVFASIGGVGSIVRIVYLFRSTGYNQETSIRSTYWTIIENGIGLTAFSLATLRPLVKCLNERRLLSQKNTSNTGSGDTTELARMRDRPSYVSRQTYEDIEKSTTGTTVAIWAER